MNSQIRTETTVVLDREVDLHILALLKIRQKATKTEHDGLLIKRITSVTDSVNAERNGDRELALKFEVYGDEVVSRMIATKRDLDKLNVALKEVQSRLNMYSND